MKYNAKINALTAAIPKIRRFEYSKSLGSPALELFHLYTDLLLRFRLKRLVKNDLLDLLILVKLLLVVNLNKITKTTIF